MKRWWLYHGTGGIAANPIAALPEPPPWRRFTGTGQATRPTDDGGEGARKVGHVPGVPRTPAPHEVEMVNSCLYLRRPLLVTGDPGTGKSALAYLIARELGLGPVLRWPITSRTMLNDGLYLYDAIARVQASNALGGTPDIGDYIHLGPLGTALLAADLPRVLLIDELDKGDIDLPNDLLNVFEEGEYEIPELVRFARTQSEVTVLTSDVGHHATVRDGRVRCREFPVVIITSNGEREFPSAFMRRCLTLKLEAPDRDRLAAMVASHFGHDHDLDVYQFIDEFQRRAAEAGPLAADQLLNAVNMAIRLTTSGTYEPDSEWAGLVLKLWHPLSAEHG
ncbi:MoxR family ATPase [Actinosynnema sp. NPDC047251]|uniref:ATPase n=1 Tax=Saccharothrix espanaensis (strain ATCC 51144 / DSM 44229 / JCM 9112 / NBRC 15066 / NRRL 15764) TaxID=1179773 RepID=K0K9V1_SACES|nr:MoxR family ATPase [Saccharothrix espanaensis]CCH33418.1 ATPase [Saccharothrix espanaensis DSM 44229]